MARPPAAADLQVVSATDLAQVRCPTRSKGPNMPSRTSPNNWLLLVAGLAAAVLSCSQDEPTTPNLTPGSIRYTLRFEGNPVPPSTWSGRATLTDAAPLFLQFYPVSESDSSSAYWTFGATEQLVLHTGTYPVTGLLGTLGDTVSVWWGHLVSGDARTIGTVTFTKTTSTQINGTFQYSGPAVVGNDTVTATVQGEFSAAP